MSPLSNEWTILEKLLLTQAVYKYGENMWFQVARVLKQHGLIQQQNIERQPDFYSQKNCSFQYYLLIENMEAEKQVFRNDLKNDMPVVVRLAKQLYMQRVDEIKNSIKKDQDEFNRLASEIDDIKAGKWDVQLNQKTETVPSVMESFTEETKEDPLSEEAKESPRHSSSSLKSSENTLKRTAEESTDFSHALKRSRIGDLTQPQSPTAEDDTTEAHVISTAIKNVKPISSISKEKVALDSDQKLSSPHAHSYSNHTISDLDNEVSTFYTHARDSKAVSDTIESNPRDEAVRNTGLDMYPRESKDKEVSGNESNPENLISSQTDDISMGENTEPLVAVSIETKNTHITQTDTEAVIPSDLASHEQDGLSAPSKREVDTPDEEYASNETVYTPPQSYKKTIGNNEQRQKAWQKNINLLWQEIANHKNGTMFMNPIKKSHAPLYDKVVKQPLYLKTIKNRVRDGVVKTTAEFERDITLMLTNSLMYNREGTEMYLMAQEMLEDVREQIRLFKSADSYSTAFWENDV